MTCKSHSSSGGKMFHIFSLKVSENFSYIILIYISDLRKIMKKYEEFIKYFQKSLEEFSEYFNIYVSKFFINRFFHIYSDFRYKDVLVGKKTEIFHYNCSIYMGNSEKILNILYCF